MPCENVRKQRQTVNVSVENGACAERALDDEFNKHGCFVEEMRHKCSLKVSCIAISADFLGLGFILLIPPSMYQKVLVFENGLQTKGTDESSLNIC